MREQNASGAQKRSSKRMAFVTSWPSWYHLSIGHGQRANSFVAGIHSNDRRTRTSPRTLTYPQLTYRLSVVFLSAGVSGIGIGEAVAKLIGS